MPFFVTPSPPKIWPKTWQILGTPSKMFDTQRLIQDTIFFEKKRNKSFMITSGLFQALPAAPTWALSYSFNFRHYAFCLIKNELTLWTCLRFTLTRKGFWKILLPFMKNRIHYHIKKIRTVMISHFFFKKELNCYQVLIIAMQPLFPPLRKLRPLV